MQDLGPKYAAYQAPTVKGAKASRPELLQVKLIDYNFEYAGKNKKAFIDRFTNDIAAASLIGEGVQVRSYPLHRHAAPISHSPLSANHTAGARSRCCWRACWWRAPSS